jgi:hypothetical protein
MTTSKTKNSFIKNNQQDQALENRNKTCEDRKEKTKQFC